MVHVWKYIIKNYIKSGDKENALPTGPLIPKAPCKVHQKNSTVTILLS